MDAKILKSKIGQLGIKAKNVFLNVDLLVMEHHCYYVIRRMWAIFAKIPRLIDENT